MKVIKYKSERLKAMTFGWFAMAWARVLSLLQLLYIRLQISQSREMQQSSYEYKKTLQKVELLKEQYCTRGRVHPTRFDILKHQIKQGNGKILCWTILLILLKNRRISKTILPQRVPARRNYLEDALLHNICGIYIVTGHSAVFFICPQRHRLLETSTAAHIMVQ